MEKVYGNTQTKPINGKEDIKFSSEPAFYLISVTARTKSEQQLGSGATDDEDLNVSIDGKTFPPKDSAVLTASPAAFSGGELHNLAKTVYFLTYLSGADHTLTLTADPEPNEATLEGVEVYTFDSTQTLAVSVNKQAEDGDRRPWITFVLVNISLDQFTIDLSVKPRFLDGDDVKIIVDGEIKRNAQSRFRRFWYFISSKKFTRDQQTGTFSVQLPVGTHYIELYADRMPILNNIRFDFGSIPVIPEPAKPSTEIHTVDDPRWTGNFADDPDQIILARAIFGEARNELVPDSARIAIAWVIRNRVESGGRWSNKYWEIITQPWQFSSFNIGDDNRAYVENPLHMDLRVNTQAWKNAYEIAGKVLNGELNDPTKGANHFYDDSIKPPDWAKSQKPKLTISYTNQFGEKHSIYFFRL